MTHVERRGAVRVPARLAMEIAIHGHASSSVESLNVSANGVYFATPKFIPVLTRLRITLDLAGEGKGARSKSVACDGVVVRIEPETEDAAAESYSVACYFTSISERDREVLEEYILRHVPF